MEDDDRQKMHPNWRALATVHIPYKRFVVPMSTSKAEQPVNGNQLPVNYPNISGPEVRQFYEDIVTSQPSITNPKQSNINNRRRRTNMSESRPKGKFDKEKFFRAALANDVSTLKSFHYKNDTINSTDMFGWSALMMAACEGSTQAVEYLLVNGAALTATDKKGNTAAMLAKSKGFPEIVKIIKNHEKPLKYKATVHQEKKADSRIEKFYCDLCKSEFSETTVRKHQTSTVHQFNMKKEKRNSMRYSIPRHNRGLKIMVKQGWDEESGLGPSGTGNLYPVKTIIRKQRTGLGVQQNPAQVTHFQPYDLAAIKYNPPPRNKSRKDMQREQRRNRRQEKRLRRELA